MGFISDIFGGGQEDAANAAADQQVQAGRDAIAASERASEKGLGFLNQFNDLVSRGARESNFLANPQAQYDFLQSNPIFNLALENANRQTNSRAASQGRLSAGDTLSQLSNNVMLSALPLLDRQRQDVGNLLNIGTGIAQSQANTAINQGTNVSNLLTDIGAAQAAGTIGAQNADTQGAGQALQLAGNLFAAFSDSRLKSSKQKTGVNENGYDIWQWQWNEEAKEKFGLEGESHGVMFNDVLKNNPEAVSYQDGYGKVNYGMIGVSHGS